MKPGAVLAERGYLKLCWNQYGAIDVEQDGGLLSIDEDELRWLIHTGGPAALAALRKDADG